MAIVNEIRAGFYLDSVALMRISRTIAALPGVEEAGLMIGTPANLEILREAGVLEGSAPLPGPGDLVIAIRASDASTAAAALTEARKALDAPRREQGAAAAWYPRTLRAAQRAMPDANLALVSVPGDFAAAEARKALRRGLDVMIFSDNVPLDDEVDLKREARDLGRLVMGPDCGTAIIAGVPLAFANVVPRGDIGLIGASGTGIQEVSCLIARAGGGISHAIGTGGRDLKSEVGAITTLMAIDAFDADPATRHVVLISKPPSADVARKVLQRIGASPKTYTVCFLGAAGLALPANAQVASTLKAAAELATSRPLGGAPTPASGNPAKSGRGRTVRGLFSGGTLCAEAQVVFRDAGLQVASNVPIPGAAGFDGRFAGNVMIDLGDDAYTRGRPHPMIEPAVRDAPLLAALSDADVAVVLLDVVLGFGGHHDPAAHLVGKLRDRPDNGPVIVASVTGTDDDPQGYARQVELLQGAGVLVAGSNADAAGLAAGLIGAGR